MLAGNLPQVDVRIHVSRLGGDNYGLDYHPRRMGDTIVYHERKGVPGSPSPVLPREVCWKVMGLEPGMTLEIAAKPGAPPVFGGAVFTVTGGGPGVVCSGPALMPATSSNGLAWDYSITLRVGNRSVVIDPTIVIINDP